MSAFNHLHYFFIASKEGSLCLKQGDLPIVFISRSEDTHFTLRLRYETEEGILK